MKRGEKYTILISEREAGLILAALEFAIKLSILLPFSEVPGELDDAKKLTKHLQREGIKMPTELLGKKEICKKDHRGARHG